MTPTDIRKIVRDKTATYWQRYVAPVLSLGDYIFVREGLKRHENSLRKQGGNLRKGARWKSAGTISSVGS